MRPVLFLSTKPYFLRGAAINHWDHRWMRAASVRPTAPAFGFLRSESSFQQVHRVVKGSCGPAGRARFVILPNRHRLQFMCLEDVFCCILTKAPSALAAARPLGTSAIPPSLLGAGRSGKHTPLAVLYLHRGNQPTEVMLERDPQIPNCGLGSLMPSWVLSLSLSL